MNDDEFTIRLGLPGIKLTKHIVVQGKHLVWAESKYEFGVCPICGVVTSSYHDSYRRTVRDLPILGQPVYLFLLQRRFLCHQCEKPFNETFEAVDVQQRQTLRLQRRLIEASRNSSIADCSRRERIGYRIVERLYYREAQRRFDEHPRRLPRWLGADEFAKRKGHNYGTVIVDLGCHRPFEVREGRRFESLAGFFRGRKDCHRVRVAVIDIWEPFYLALVECCPKAHVVIDHFHVIKHAASALDDCRKRLQRKVPPEAKKRLKAIRKILSKSYGELSMEEQQELKAVLAEHPELRKAHRLTEYIRHWYRTEDIHKARQRLGYWLGQVKLSGIPEFQELAKMMRRWRKSILNYFLVRLTNGPVEGIINKIKLIKRMAYGLPNFSHIRARILLEFAPARSPPF